MHPLASTSETNGHAQPAISLRNGPVDDDAPMENGANSSASMANGKRKSTNGHNYKEATSDDDDEPLVSIFVP